MPCYKPLKAFHAPGGISFNHNDSFGIPISLPCGRCIGCRLEKAKDWALRCHHEASMHDKNDFLTLTYDDAHLPKDATLKKSDFQKFIRSLRQKTKEKIRYYMCGEYGEATEKNGQIARPHYHAIIFGYSFPHQKLVNVRNNNRVYTSSLLAKLWPHGSHEIGTVTFQSAGYVARYILKKQNGEYGLREYGIPNKQTGEISADHQRVYPYTNMSLKPGIGKTWYDKFKSDLFPADFAVMPDGRTTAVPTYYRKLLEAENPALAETLRRARVDKSRSNPNNTPHMLEMQETVKIAQTKSLKRNL